MDKVLKKWWEDITYREAKSYIQENIQSMARDYIAIGYFLRLIRDNGSFREGGYGSIHEFANAEFGMRKSTVNHCIRINAEFSEGGNSPIVESEYQEFSKAQLQELLYVPEEKRDGVTPDMTVAEIREIHKPERLDIEPQDHNELDTGKPAGNLSGKEVSERQPQEEPKSFFGFPKTVYPEGFLLTTPGCGDGKYSCFSCARPCGIRQRERYCVEAPMGNPFSCTQMSEEKRLDIEAGLFSGECQFFNLENAVTRKGDHEPEPCCKDCENKTCFSRCDIAKKKDGDRRKKVQAELQKQQKKAEAQKPDMTMEENRKSRKPKRLDVEPGQKETEKPTEDSGVKDVPVVLQEKPDVFGMDMDTIDVQYREEPAEITAKDLLDRKQRELDKWMEAMEQDGDYGIPPGVEELRIIVQALELLAEQQHIPEDGEEPQEEQPPLPALKNDEQRKEWLKRYQEWGLWYEDEHIGVKYYRYCFENGAELIVDEYLHHNRYVGDYVTPSCHLVGGPEPQKRNGIDRWQRHEQYSRYPSSDSELVEFLKFVQKENTIKAKGDMES